MNDNNTTIVRFCPDDSDFDYVIPLSSIKSIAFRLITSKINDDDDDTKVAITLIDNTVYMGKCGKDHNSELHEMVHGYD